MSNAEKAVPEVTISIGGKKRRLIFNLNSLRKIQKVTGKNALDGELWNNPDAEIITVLLWGGLIKEDPSLSVDDVGEMIEIRDIRSIGEAIQLAFAQASPPEDEEKKTETETISETQDSLPTGSDSGLTESTPSDSLANSSGT